MKHSVKLLNKENNERDKQLTGDYDLVMTDMVCYLRGADLSDAHIEEVRRDLLDMFIEAKEREEPVETLVGGDYKEFCDNILESVPKKTKKEKFFGGLSTVLLCIGIIGLIKFVISETTIQMIADVITQSDFSAGVELTAGDLAMGALLIILASMVVHWICRNSFETGKKIHKAAVVLLLICFAIVWAVSQTILSNYIIVEVDYFIGVVVMLMCIVLSRLFEEVA